MDGPRCLSEPRLSEAPCKLGASGPRTPGPGCRANMLFWFMARCEAEVVQDSRQDGHHGTCLAERFGSTAQTGSLLKRKEDQQVESLAPLAASSD